MFGPRFTPWLLLAAIGAPAAPTRAQVEDDRISLAMDADGLPLREFMRLAQLLGGITVTTEVPGAEARVIEPIQPVQMDRDQFVQLFEAVVYRIGLACARPNENDPSKIELAELADDAVRMPQTSGSRFIWPNELRGKHGTGPVFTSVRVSSLTASRAAAMLTSRGLDDCTVAAASNAVLVQGPHDRVAAAAHYVQYVDLPTEGPMEKVASGFTFVEGPAWDPHRHVLLFSDIPKNQILELGEKDRVRTFLEPSHGSNGLMFDTDGNLFACCGYSRELVRIAPDGSRTVLASRFDEKLLNSPNDLALDDHGGIYFTDPRYGNADNVEQDKMCVYYVDRDGNLTRVIDSLQRPNGIVVSNDGRTIVVAEPNKREIWSYPIRKPGVVDRGTRMFVSEKSIDGGGPDGMAYDVDGNLYATYGNLLVLAPDGRVIRRIRVPEKPANCTFGGRDNKTLFVTARTSLYRMPSEIAGAPLRRRVQKR